MGSRISPAYARVEELIRADRCVVLDGGIGTELPRAAARASALDERLWGVGSLVDAPDAVLRVHRGYVEAGCDVVTTHTWGLPTALADADSRLWELTRSVHWVDVARRGLRLARQAAGESSAVAFSLNGDVDAPGGEETIQLLSRLFADEPPDVILLETLSLVRESLYATVEALLATGLPVWLSFRRCRHGLCGVYGEHWGGPEGDAFGRAALRFEQLGVRALLINCIPPDHVEGMVPYLRDFTDLPLGVYPNLGYFTDDGWRDLGVGGPEYAALAQRWRAQGAQLIGGCCGTGPEHIAAAREAVRDRPAGRAARRRHRRRARQRTGRGPGAAPAGLDRPPQPAAVPAAVPRPRGGARRRGPRRRQLPRVGVPVPRGDRRPRALPRPRLRHRGPRRPARAQRRGPRARARRRPARRREHPDERVPQRRRGPDQRRARPTCTPGCPRSATR